MVGEGGGRRGRAQGGGGIVWGVEMGCLGSRKGDRGGGGKGRTGVCKYPEDGSMQVPRGE